ncbi:MAG: CcmD family protein [Flammeovirgaceae bacterium]|nr:CcmD family protein [Flammeovirgaceae bacterium]
MILIGVSISLTTSFDAAAQEKYKVTEKDYANSDVDMADEMRANGKIYIVVATIISIISGILVYLIMLDKKVKKLEDLTETIAKEKELHKS